MNSVVKSSLLTCGSAIYPHLGPYHELFPKQLSSVLKHLSGTSGLLILVLLAALRPTQAQTYTLAHKFNAAKGGLSFGGLITDGKGHFFGTAQRGGDSDNGTVFEISSTGAETLLYSFTGGADGAGPGSALTRDSSGNLYGTTELAGDLNCSAGTFGSNGCGTVFKISTAGEFGVLHAFTGAADGALPGGPLVVDSSSNLYGVTSVGGTYGFGTVFKITSSGEMTELYSFGGTRGDAEEPYGGLLLLGNDLYGASQSGGSFGQGAIFKLGLDGNENIFFSFERGTGSDPTTPLVSDSAGNLYSSSQGSAGEGGIVFQLSPAGKETILYTFPLDGIRGLLPDAGLSIDAAGNLYGTTFYGGTGTGNNCTFGCGTVFRLSPHGGTWNETVLHNFDGSDGALPEAVLLIHNGSLYGTTIAGGIENAECDYPNYLGCGVAFRISH